MSPLHRLPYPVRFSLAFMSLALASMTAFALLALRLGGPETHVLGQPAAPVFLGLATAALAAAGVQGWLLGRSVAAPLADLGRSMQAVARHDLDHPVAGLDRDDEFGSMAVLLCELRDSLRQSEGLKVEQDARGL